MAAPGAIDTGRVYCYVRNFGGVDVWGQIAILVPTDGMQSAGDGFGSSLAVNGGTLIAIGSPNHMTARGAVYIYERNAPSFEQYGFVAKIMSPLQLVGLVWLQHCAHR